jgi:hypothetical protein
MRNEKRESPQGQHCNITLLSLMPYKPRAQMSSHKMIPRTLNSIYPAHMKGAKGKQWLRGMTCKYVELLPINRKSPLLERKGQELALMVQLFIPSFSPLLAKYRIRRRGARSKERMCRIGRSKEQGGGTRLVSISWSQHHLRPTAILLVLPGSLCGQVLSSPKTLSDA